jgi:hypothetical protein
MSRIECFLIEVKSGRWRRPGERRYAEDRIPVGAMWFAPWLDRLYRPQLKHVLIVRTPGGDWTIDGEANNCTMPNQPIAGTANRYNRYQEDHHCWIIEGSVPNITVSKNGVTCGAGAGSILQGSYHGFLRNGYLEES